jgi:putative heme iron utilization protein
MGSAAAGEYRAAEPDPVAPIAARAAAHLNDDHADALLDIAHVLGGRPDASAARCTHIDRYGLDLDVAGDLIRVDFPEPLRAADELRSATVKLARRAQAS